MTLRERCPTQHSVQLVHAVFSLGCRSPGSRQEGKRRGVFACFGNGTASGGRDFLFNDGVPFAAARAASHPFGELFIAVLADKENFGLQEALLRKDNSPRRSQRSQRPYAGGEHLLRVITPASAELQSHANIGRAPSTSAFSAPSAVQYSCLHGKIQHGRHAITLSFRFVLAQETFGEPVRKIQP